MEPMDYRVRWRGRWINFQAYDDAEARQKASGAPLQMWDDDFKIWIDI